MLHNGKCGLIGAGSTQVPYHERRVGSIVVAVDLECHKPRHLCLWIRYSPQCANVESLASKDAQNVCLRNCAVDVLLAAPVVFVNGRLGSWIVLGYPLFQHRISCVACAGGCSLRCNSHPWCSSAAGCRRLCTSDPRRLVSNPDALLLTCIACRSKRDGVALIVGCVIRMDTQIVKQSHSVSFLRRRELLQIYSMNGTPPCAVRSAGLLHGELHGPVFQPASTSFLE